jgi:hypothetical protein
MSDPSLYIERATVQFNLGSYTDLTQHPELTLQDTLGRECTLRLFVENQESELQSEDNQTWTPVQRQYGPCFLDHVHSLMVLHM